jgi:hypothetical protein
MNGDRTEQPKDELSLLNKEVEPVYRAIRSV